MASPSTKKEKESTVANDRVITLVGTDSPYIIDRKAMFWVIERIAAFQIIGWHNDYWMA
jgi:hypothetical protein